MQLLKKKHLQDVVFRKLFHFSDIYVEYWHLYAFFGKNLKKWHVDYLKNGARGQIKPYIFLKEDIFTIPKHIWFIVTPCAVFEIFNDVSLIRRLLFNKNYEKKCVKFSLIRPKIVFFSKILSFSSQFIYILTKYLQLH